MATAWTIRSRLNPVAICRPASLNSLPDLSDNLEIEGRPSSGSSTLFISPGNFELWGQNSSDFLTDSLNYRHRSNISVSFLGSRIRRQYRSSFMLSDDQMIGVTRCETFQPEDAKADVRVSLSLLGPPNRLVVTGQHHSRSAPSLIPNNFEDDRDWARLMLTTDRPRDSELVGRIGSRSYFTNSESGAPYFHRRITPMQKEEEYIFLHTSPLNANTSIDEDFDSRAVDGAKEGVIEPGSLTVPMTRTGSDAEPSTERVEKDTCQMLYRHQEGRSSAVSPLGPISLSEKELSLPIPESQSPCTQQISDYLPSTERSESIIYLKRTKSETSLSAQTPTSIVTPWLESLHPKSSVAPSLGAVKVGEAAGVGERSTPQVDNTLSLHTDFEEEEEVEDHDKGAVGAEKEGKRRQPFFSCPPCNSPEVTELCPPNGVVAPFRSVGGQECSYRLHGHMATKSTILYTSLQMNRTSIHSNGTTDVESEESKAETLQDFKNTEVNLTALLPRKRRRAFQQYGEEVEDASQTDETQTLTGTSTHVSERDYYAGGSEQSAVGPRAQPQLARFPACAAQQEAQRHQQRPPAAQTCAPAFQIWLLSSGRPEATDRAGADRTTRANRRTTNSPSIKQPPPDLRARGHAAISAEGGDNTPTHRMTPPPLTPLASPPCERQLRVETRAHRVPHHARHPAKHNTSVLRAVRTALPKQHTG
ncbi:hypothetical protein TcWFU_004364 [Taenia crassiceps]|uniref:Uncharacterized protein n=1 Tax=Taenia crassiceps TaxID=6207 RepID=A0ABR4QR85_9CEST